MQKRTFPMYMFLNCLTLGIYGFVVAKKMGEEINALCKGDDQEPAVGYVANAFIRLIPGFGILYYNYWWYQQINRIKLNANRYDLTVKESGTEAFLMRTVVPMTGITLLIIGLASLLPGLLVLLFTLIHPVMGIIFGILFVVILAFFSGELTAGAAISNYYLMKNLNRFADVYRNGATLFDPMAYEYYPTVDKKYPNFLPNAVNGVVVAPPPVAPIDDGPVYTDPIPSVKVGTLIGVKGTFAGYRFDMVNGEEIVIGKDAKEAQVVIETAYKEISRKHVGVRYDIIRDQYCVVDYSSNGTWVNGSKMIPGQEAYLPHGTELKLANDKNIFRLG